MQRRYSTLPLEFTQLSKFHPVQRFSLPLEPPINIQFSKTGTYVALSTGTQLYLSESMKIANLKAWSLFQFEAEVKAFVFLRPTREHKVQELLVCSGTQLIVISLDSKQTRRCIEIPLNSVSKLLRTDENLYYLAISEVEDSIYFVHAKNSESSFMLQCQELMGVTNRPRFKVLLICERTLLETEKLGLSVKYLSYEKEQLKTVKHLKIPYIASAVEFSQSAAYLAILNFKEVTLISLSNGMPLKSLTLKEEPSCLNFLPNDRHLVIGDKAGDLFIVELKSSWSQLVILMSEKKSEIVKVKMNPRKFQLLSVAERGELVHWGV